MKTVIYKVICYVLIIALLMPMQSCATAIGFTAGAMKDRKASKKSQIALLDTPGWYEPTNDKFRLELTLESGERITGKYIGMDTPKEDRQIVESVMIKNNGDVRSLPIKQISYTKIYPAKKNRKIKGLLYGALVDIVLMTTIIATANDWYEWDVNIWGPN